ncbi:MAG: ankyrin repeat domain-containing protein [Planctomycetota bacterium]|jgi:WD40 repeat protein/ankyrin repeat protein/tRNA A-37 threonylcarbamoyl transferase component Bud32
MSKKRKDINLLFLEVLEKPTVEERTSYLDEVCRGDAELRAELESLLQAHEQAGSFLEGSDLAAKPTLDEAPMTEVPGTIIGRYKLLEKIGEGGMAYVYMAEQEKPIRRRVALKIIKLGMDTKQVIARFEAERQALALMDHPNISKVLDAGATETGRPYFAMELVKGISITEYCDKNKLTTQERLDLFVQVCNAVQHAHQKGIIHRDIKPTNVMVTLHDDIAVPKVIDFGIAKATSQKLTEQTLFTRYAQMIGTPEYMSPEQAQLSGLDIDTRTDIYSLGILLYELLTGVTPFDTEKLREAGYLEMQRIIREEEPLKPSTKLSTLGDTLTDVAEHRRASPDLLQKLMRGDLDWIVMKSLEKDRTRRYGTATELSADIARHLYNEPVQAAAPSVSYRLCKYIRRHRVGVMAGSLVTAALVLGFVLATYGLVRARLDRDRSVQAEMKAVGERERAEEQKQIADRQRNEARRSLYCAHMLMARQDWEGGRVARLWELLDVHRPKPGDQDFRGWEWYYLQALLHKDLFTLRGHTDAVRSVAWNPDRRHLASASDDHTVRIWDAVEGKQISVLRGHTARVNSAAWSPDGRYLASASDDETVKIWDWTTGKTILMLGEHKCPVSSVTWSPDSKQLASAGEDSKVRVWDAATGKESLYLLCKERTEPILSVAWSPDGKWLAVGHRPGPDGHGTVIVWNMATKKYRQLRDLKGHRAINSVVWNPNSKLVACTTEHMRIKVWDAAAGQRKFDLFDHKGWVNSASWSPDGQRLASVSNDQTLKIWDVETREVVVTFCGHTGPVHSVDWSPDGQRLATGSEDGTLKIWDATKKEEAANTRTFSNWVSSVSWSPDGRRLATAYLRPTVEIWDPVTGQVVLTLQGHKYSVWCVTWSPDGKMLATASKDKMVKIWDAGSGQVLRTLRGHRSEVKSVAFSPDGRRIVTGSYDQTIIVWDTQTGTELMSMPEHDASVCSVSISPDGKRVASTSVDGKIKIWDPNTGQVILSFRGGMSRVNALAWNPNASQLAASSNDGRIAVWETVGGRQVFSVQGHTGSAFSIRWSPDGRQLASGGGDRTIKIRDAATGEEVISLRGHEAPVFSVAWSPDGWRLASGGFDSTAKVWDASIGYALEGDPNLVTHGFEYVRRYSAQVYTERGIAKDREKKYNEAIVGYGSAVEVDPSYAPAYKGLAWLLATCPAAEWRDGAKAVENATKACELTSWKNANYLDTLAAAYAEAGDFDEAIKWQQKAIDLLGEGQSSRYQLRFKAKMELYQTEQPYHRQRLLAKQMIAWWKFDQAKGKSVLDSSGNDLHGKLMGDAHFISDPIRGNVLNFDGDGDYVDCGNDWTFDITGSITVAAWIKVNAFDKGWQTIVAKGDTAWRLSRDRRNNGIEFACKGLRVAGPSRGNIVGQGNVNDGRWHHVCGTYDRVHIRLYVDGVEDSASPAAYRGNIGTNNYNLWIGDNSQQPGREWNGLIDDVRICSYALSQDEINALYDFNTSPETVNTLHEVASKGDLEKVRTLISEGADLNAKNKKKATPLYLATQSGNKDVARLLIEKGANVNVKGGRLWTPLHVAARFGHKDIVKLLIAKGANLNVVGSGGWTPLLLAVRFGYTDIAKLLIDNNADIYAETKLRMTPLLFAVLHDRQDIEKLLIDKGVHLDIFTESIRGNADRVAALLESDPNLINAQRNLFTPLHWAAYCGHLNVSNLLIAKGADVNANSKHASPLYWAVRKDYPDVVRLLIDKGADVNARGAYGATVLHYVLTTGVVELLIDKGAEVNARDNSERTPLHYISSKTGHTGVLKLLIPEDADISAEHPEALHVKVAEGQAAVAKLLIEKGADVNAKDKAKRTPQDYAERAGYEAVVEVLRKSQDL